MEIPIFYSHYSYLLLLKAVIFGISCLNILSSSLFLISLTVFFIFHIIKICRDVGSVCFQMDFLTIFKQLMESRHCQSGLSSNKLFFVYVHPSESGVLPFESIRNRNFIRNIFPNDEENGEPSRLCYF